MTDFRGSAAVGPTARLVRAARTALAACALLAAAASAQETRTGKITYVTSTTAFVDLGTRDGFDVGDTLRAVRGGTAIADLVVTNIASRSMATRILAPGVRVLEGDAVRGVALHASPAPRPTARTDSARTDTAAAPVLRSTAEAAPRTPTPAAARTLPPLRGRVSTQYYALASTAVSGLEFSQPALSISLNADRILDAPLSFSLYTNHRFDARSDALRGGAPGDRWSHRIYDVSLRYGESDAPVRATLGRFIAPAVGGIGSFDGAMLVAASGGWEGGLLGGSQPGYTNSAVSPDAPKFAAYLAYSAGSYETVRYQGSAAFAQTYVSGGLDRSFFYLQNVSSFGASISLYQNASIDLYDVGGGMRPHLSDLFLSASWRPIRWLAANGSWSTRRNVYFLRSYRFAPDSLFDRTATQYAQLGIGVNLPTAMFLSLGGTLRANAHDARPSTALIGRYSWANVLRTETGVSLTGSIADNLYNRTSNTGVELTRDVFGALYLSLRAQRFAYAFGSRIISRTSGSLDAYWRIDRAWFLTVSFESYWEAGARSDRLYTDLSFRF